MHYKTPSLLEQRHGELGAELDAQPHLLSGIPRNANMQN